jgi:hypothetical protein
MLFSDPLRLSPSLATFMGVSSETRMSRPEVVKSITRYVRDNGLLALGGDKRVIVPDAPLRELLLLPSPEPPADADTDGDEDAMPLPPSDNTAPPQITCFNIWSMLRHHFPDLFSAEFSGRRAKAVVDSHPVEEGCGGDEISSVRGGGGHRQRTLQDESEDDRDEWILVERPNHHHRRSRANVPLQGSYPNGSRDSTGSVSTHC